MGIKQLQQDWDKFGRKDPLWAVYSSHDRRGGRWDEESFFATGRTEVARILALTEPPRDGRCLDFGCGVGRLTLPLAQHFSEVIGVDIAPSMLEMAQQYVGGQDNITLVLNQKEDLRQFADESFDFINCSIVLQHMSPRLTSGYLQEFSRLLTPAGQLVFTLPSEPGTSFRGRLYRIIPRRVINAYKRQRDGALMEMNGIPIGRLIGQLEGFRLVVNKVRSSDSAGPNWTAYQYCCAKPWTKEWQSGDHMLAD